MKALLTVAPIADLAEFNGGRALYLAAQNGHDSIVDLLLDADAGTRWQAPDGTTALFIAVSRGHRAIARKLAPRSNLNAQTRAQGVTALVVAAQIGDPEMVKILLENGADVNLPAFDGGTALWIAELKGNSEAYALLLDAGARSASPAVGPLGGLMLGAPVARSDRRCDITGLQIRLSELGLDPGLRDGLWGPKTESAVRAFQVGHGLAVSGKPDAPTCSALGLRLR